MREDKTMRGLETKEDEERRGGRESGRQDNEKTRTREKRMKSKKR